MEYTYYTDLNSMLQALAAGIIMGVYYDIFRFARRLFHFSNFSVIIQDIIFWLSSAIYIFFVCVKLNNGYIRIYFVVFALIGWGVYFFTLGKIIFIIFDFIIKILRSFYYKIKKRITLSTVAILIKTKSQS